MSEHISGQEISSFLDGALTAEAQARVAAHLQTCGQCDAELSSLGVLKKTLTVLPRRGMPADLALALERRFVKPAASWWTGLPRPLLWAPAGAFAAAALALGLWLHGRSVEDMPLEPLLAAHVRYSAEALVPQDNIVASTYSDQLTALYSDASDLELE